MSASERAKKKRVRSALFPHQSAAARTRYAGRKRDAKWQRREDSDAEDDWQCQMTPTTAESALQQHREKVVRSCVEWMVGVVERAIAADCVDHIESCLQPQHVYAREVRGCIHVMDSRGVGVVEGCIL